MPVSLQTPTIIYTANGSVSIFAFPFRVIDLSDLRVYVDGVLTTAGIVVDGINNPSGGSVTFTVPPVAGTVIRIQRTTSVDRATDYVEGGQLSAQTLDNDFDRIVMMVQEVNSLATLESSDGTLTFNYRRGINLADPIDAQDAATKHWAETSMSSSVASALSSKNAAAASAAAAATSATNAYNATFPAGTRMLFAQASAPAGWTQDVTDKADNRMLRVVKTAGNGVAGSHSPILNNVVPAHTHGFSTGYQSADHAHYTQTGDVSADHSHGFGDPGHAHTFGGYGGVATGFYGGYPGWVQQTNWTGGSGTGCWIGGITANHYHAGWSGGVNTNHTHSGTTDNGSSQTNWTPRYIDIIICTKD